MTLVDYRLTLDSRFLTSVFVLDVVIGVSMVLVVIGIAMVMVVIVIVIVLFFVIVIVIVVLFVLACRQGAKRKT